MSTGSGPAFIGADLPPPLDKLMNDVSWALGIFVLLPWSIAIDVVAIFLHYLREAWKDFCRP